MLLGSLGKLPGITWYDVLGVLPGATAEQVKQQHDAKTRLLRPELIAGAPSPVIAATSRAHEILDAARRVLADPANRAHYDAERLGAGFIADSTGLEVLHALLTPNPYPSIHVAVPDVRALFYSVCLGITGKLGFRLNTLRLTEHPMPVDGLVIGQSPWPAEQARRGSALTVQVWHPPARSAGGFT